VIFGSPAAARPEHLARVLRGSSLRFESGHSAVFIAFF
jgi:hypothetical protein